MPSQSYHELLAFNQEQMRDTQVLNSTLVLSRLHFAAQDLDCQMTFLFSNRTATLSIVPTITRYSYIGKDRNPTENLCILYI